MCGRFSLDASIDVLIERYRSEKGIGEFDGKDEIFPTNVVPIVVNDGIKLIRMMKWGFVPSFTNNPIINARSETIDLKPLFRDSFFTNRCIVPVTSFYEWKNENGKKVKKRISIESQQIFSLAGLYRVFRDKNDSEIEFFTIITTKANDVMHEIHNRMPVILSPDIEDIWLDNKFDNIDIIKSFLKPYNENELIIV